MTEINQFISSSVEKINAFQSMVEQLSRESNLCRSAINDLGFAALHEWETQKGSSLSHLAMQQPAQRVRGLDQIIGYFEKCMQENTWSDSMIQKNLVLIRQTLETIFEIRSDTEIFSG
ncbi:MAG: hypothetical protein E4G98_04785 [Promethearchaeota archaeon]|nr:MAG: hypothetical protein E4G98_04785 [Candidatus Lokiarchaeota archaeon]